MKAKIVTVKLSAICTDAGTQSRAGIDEAVVADYAEAMLGGAVFPPVTVFQDGALKILADGFHRVRAAKKARFTRIAADLRPGGRLDALKFSLTANHAHGLRRTNADKQHAVNLALSEFSHMSDRMISGMCGVSITFVGNIRRQLSTVDSCRKRMGKDGKTRKMPIVAASPLKAGTLQVHVPNRQDGAAHEAVMEIARALASIETEIRKTLERHPSAKPVVIGLIAKVRDDLAFLSRHITGKESR